jgi:hypothetical protein
MNQQQTYRVRGFAWDGLDPALSKFDKMPPNVSWTRDLQGLRSQKCDVARASTLSSSAPADSS